MKEYLEQCFRRKVEITEFEKNKSLVDPLTVLLSLSDEEKADDRVRISIEEMLREYVW